jgi:hypothetical protein
MIRHLDPALPPAAIAASLDAPARQLVVAVRSLYQGSWEDCAEDIRRRRAGRPYLFRLELGLDDELAWIHRFITYESARGESLAALPLENLR